IRGYMIGLRTNSPRGLLGKKTVLYRSMLATVKPITASPMNTQLWVKKLITVLHVMAMNGLRKNLKVSNPSLGASFHAPPNALNHPPALASSSTSHFGASGCAAWSRMTPHTVRVTRSEEHTSELQSHLNLVCRLL